jgi:hypothetical protein
MAVRICAITSLEARVGVIREKAGAGSIIGMSDLRAILAPAQAGSLIPPS